jgi:nucleoside-diphosphate-sugar epimerase
VKGFSIVGDVGKIGEIYHIADARHYTIKETVETIADVLGRNLKEITIPKSFIWMGGLFFQPFKMLGLNPPLDLSKYLEMTASSAFNISKIRELGYNPEDNFRKNIESTISWCKENKLID